MLLTVSSKKSLKNIGFIVSKKKKLNKKMQQQLILPLFFFYPIEIQTVENDYLKTPTVFFFSETSGAFGFACYIYFYQEIHFCKGLLRTE